MIWLSPHPPDSTQREISVFRPKITEFLKRYSDRRGAAFNTPDWRTSRDSRRECRAGGRSVWKYFLHSAIPSVAMSRRAVDRSSVPAQTISWSRSSKASLTYAFHVRDVEGSGHRLWMSSTPPNPGAFK